MENIDELEKEEIKLLEKYLKEYRQAHMHRNLSQYETIFIFSQNKLTIVIYFSARMVIFIKNKLRNIINKSIETIV